MLTNEEYAESVGAKKQTEAYTRLLERMASYGDNRWWLSEDPRERAYRQTMEEIQILDWMQYGKDLMALLNRPILPYELVLDDFKQECERAWKYGVGCTSEAEARERQKANIEKLLDIAISKASPETLQEAMHLAGKLCPCPDCVDKRKCSSKGRKRGTT